jgi:hypothetical protein
MKKIGRKGGTNANAGKKAETIVGTLGTLSWQKRVFMGQRALVVLRRDEISDEHLLAASNLEWAKSIAKVAFADGYCIAIPLAATPI